MQGRIVEEADADEVVLDSILEIGIDIDWEEVVFFYPVLFL